MRYHIEFDISLRKNPYKGVYIAIEGIDGSGKTTQAEKLARYFKEKGKIRDSKLMIHRQDALGNQYYLP